MQSVVSKILLPFLILSCHPDIDQPLSNYSDKYVAHGTNGQINWTCLISKETRSTILLGCQFDNISVDMAPNVCVKVSFFDKLSSKVIVQSDRVCSGILPGKEFSKNYTDLRDDRRQALKVCGKKLELCDILAEIE